MEGNKQNDVLEIALDRLNQEGLWFTTKEDKLYANATDLFKLDKYGELEDKSKERLIKEVEANLGEGATFIIEAVDIWIEDNITLGTIGYVDTLAMNFEIKPVSEEVEAYDEQGKKDLELGTLDEKGKEKKLEEGKKVYIKQLKEELEQALKEYMLSPEAGFDEEDKGPDRYGFNAHWKQYCGIDVKTDKDGDYLIYVNAELCFDSILNLADKLNKVVSKYDKEAYFDNETSGRLVCLMSKNTVKNMTEGKKLQESSNTFQQRLDDIFAEVELEEEYGGYRINNTPLCITDNVADSTGEFVEGICFYTTNVYVIPAVGGGKLDIQAPRFIKGQDGTEYGDSLYFYQELTDKDIMDIYDLLKTEIRMINPNDRDENGMSKLVEGSKEEDKLPSKEDFEAYEKVRQSGQYNMLIDFDAVLESGLDEDTYKSVMRNYGKLKQMYQKENMEESKELDDMKKDNGMDWAQNVPDTYRDFVDNFVIDLTDGELNHITVEGIIEEYRDSMYSEEDELEEFENEIYNSAFDSYTKYAIKKAKEKRNITESKKPLTELYHVLGVRKDKNGNYKEEWLIAFDTEEECLRFREEQEKNYQDMGYESLSIVSNEEYNDEDTATLDYSNPEGWEDGDSFEVSNGEESYIITKRGNKWIDNEGNRYMGYLCPRDVASYYHGFKIVESRVVENKSVNLKRGLTEGIRQRLNERNTQSAEIIEKALTGITEQTSDKESGIITKTSELFNSLSDRGYDVQVSFDNGESTSSIAIGQQGANILITITDPEQPLRAFASGNFEINDDSLKMIKSIMEVL